MFKKFLTALIASAAAFTMAGCSDYVMTEKDLAVQKSIEGYWAAGSETGYNIYDADGNPELLMVVEFTDDFKYFLHECYVNEGYVMTYDPIIYSFENEMFKVDVDGVDSYARISVSDDGQIMKWINDDLTDAYYRISEDEAKELGIPEYDREHWSTERPEDEDAEYLEENNDESTAE